MILYLTIFIFWIFVYIWYGEGSFQIYFSLGLTCTLYPIIWMLISLKLKEMIVLLKSNNDLIHTIETILKVFPEGVMIRSVDEISRRTILKFANNIANRDLVNYENKDINIKVFDNESFSEERKMQHSISLDMFLNRQESNLESSQNDWVDQLILIKKKICQLQEGFVKIANIEEKKEELFFNVKTIKVSRDKNNQSFMHVFINTTQVKKLEEERANREYQHMMFASLSHELRTPLNAFSNSLNLVQITF